MYFQEKVSHLFLKKDVMKMFVEEKSELKKKENPVSKRSKNFKGVFSSDVSEDPKSPEKVGELRMRDSVLVAHLVEDFETEKLSKKLSYNLNFKMKTEKIKIAEDCDKNMIKAVEKVTEKEEFFEKALNTQTADIQKRLNNRKMMSMVKKSRNTSTIGSKLGSSILDILKEGNKSFLESDKMANVLAPVQNPQSLKEFS